MNVEIGNLVSDKKPLKLDLPRLIETRMGVFASSGGGKSFALFQIIEATSGLLPQIILDREGEFSPLRKKFDFLLAGPGGDFPANPALAATLVAEDGTVTYGACERAILKFMLVRPTHEYSKVQLAVGSDYSLTSSSFKNALGKLKTYSMVTQVGERFILMSEDRAKEKVGNPAPEAYHMKFLDILVGKLPKCEREIMDVILAHPGGQSKEEIAAKTQSNYSVTSSSFKNAIGKLTSLEFVLKNMGLYLLNQELADL